MLSLNTDVGNGEEIGGGEGEELPSAHRKNHNGFSE